MSSIEYIKEKISMEDVLANYGIYPNHSKRYQCVFHHGKDHNMVVLDHRVAYCFVCNERGDIIDVVQSLFGISRAEAMQKLCYDFAIDTTSKEACEFTPIKRDEYRREQELKDKTFARLLTAQRATERDLCELIAIADRQEVSFAEIYSLQRKLCLIGWLQSCVTENTPEVWAEDEFVDRYGYDCKDIIARYNRGEIPV